MATGAPPASLKQVNSFLKLAKEYDKIDSTVAYFCRMYAVQKGIKLDGKSKEGKQFLFGLMDKLETEKKALAERGDEAVSNELVAQAHLESVALGLFTRADGEDRQGIFNKNVTKRFYSSSLLFEVLEQFGPLSEELKIQQRYAKWKATYLHKCMQTGETPVPGPDGSGFEEGLNSLGIYSSETNEQPGPSGYSTDQYQPSPGYPTDFAAQNFMPTPVLPPPSQPIPKPRQPTMPPVINPGDSNESDLNLDNDRMVDFNQAEKLCKYAISALQYEDVPTAIDNLTKALELLKK